MRQRSAGWKMFPEPTQSEQPVPTKNHYTRWYMWLIYLALGALLVAGVSALVVSLMVEDRQEDNFVTSCYLAVLETQLDITVRHCQCIWDELRNHYDADEITTWLWGSTDPDRRFDDRFIDDRFKRAGLDCE